MLCLPSLHQQTALERLASLHRGVRSRSQLCWFKKVYERGDLLEGWQELKELGAGVDTGRKLRAPQNHTLETVKSKCYDLGCSEYDLWIFSELLPEDCAQGKEVAGPFTHRWQASINGNFIPTNTAFRWETGAGRKGVRHWTYRQTGTHRAFPMPGPVLRQHDSQSCPQLVSVSTVCLSCVFILSLQGPLVSMRAVTPVYRLWVPQCVTQ